MLRLRFRAGVVWSAAGLALMALLPMLLLLAATWWLIEETS